MRLTVNGAAADVQQEPDRSLLHVLRDEMSLLAAKPGCGEGACGACTVLVDGQPIRSCTKPIAQVADHAVDTLEGLREQRTWQAVIDAFTKIRAFQCGFCTPGMVVAAGARLAANRSPSDDDIVAALESNVCRCGTYPRILRAVHQAADFLASDTRPDKAQATDADGDARFAERPALPWDLAAADQRDYFERLGDGLVVVLTPDQAEHVNEPRGAWSAAGGAWLHVGVDGRVTAFTGKVDVGQDNRTELAGMVAAEMGIEPEQVALFMGDTDFAPYDMGTFGSRSTEDAGGVLRAVAATARAWLAAHGAPTNGTCHVEHARGNAAGAGHASTPGSRASAPGIAAGTQRYTSDLALPDMLHGRVLRPPTYGAELKSADLGAVRRMADVVAVHEESFVGVAAPTPQRAREAIKAVRADWRAGPTVEEDKLAEYLRAHPDDEQGWGGAFRHVAGDVEATLAMAAHALEATYTTAYIAHVPLETRCAVAAWHDDRLTVWTGTQRPFGVREQLAGELGVDEAQVRVIVPPTGAGYGGKHSGEAAVEAARLARAAGRPVKVRWSRTEEFAGAYFRPAAVIDVRAGIDAQGRITAWRFTNTNSGPMAIAPPYEIANQALEYRPAASPFRQGSYRALAATANNFARESAIDELAHAAGADPVHFRLRQLADSRLAQVLRAAADGIGWHPGGALGAGHGLGIACGLEKGSRIATAVELEADGPAANGSPDVRLTRIVTAFDCGAVMDADNLRNQVEGATVMGLGGALFEAIHWADGHLTNGTMTDYRVPRFRDVPPIEVILVERPDQPPAGAGETPIIAIAPAIANALYAATGERRRSLPLLG
jgi:nicotinate dehydrogenase subunit B